MVSACDPTIEVCEDAEGFKNTIELDYATPNYTIGVLSILNAFVPYLVYKFSINNNRSAVVQGLYDSNSLYDFGWRWLETGSLFFWGVPSALWIASQLFDT